jgi:ACS family tartrate transporter-like MFS transporter
VTQIDAQRDALHREAAGPAAVEAGAIRKISWRLLPLIVAAYCVAYIDRSNVSFAALTMNKDLGLNSYEYGLGAGIFFIGYFIFEVPSNVILEKVGARIWIARIMFVWGLVSASAALATGPESFLAIRFLLGAAEAGFFPGVILYFTYWYPARYRGRVISALFLAQPIANGLASVASGLLLEMDGILGLKGWQWVFVLEAVPAIILAFVVLGVMTDRPSVATWLTGEEKSWLENELEGERRAVEKTGKLSLWQSLKDPRVLKLSFIYFSSTTANYGIVFFLPQIVKGLGLTNVQTGFVSAIPYVIGMAGLILWGWSSDRNQERRWHLIAGITVGAAGLVLAGWFGSTYAGLAGLTLAVVGIYGSRTAFWPMPSLFLTGTAAAAGIALVNATGNLGGYLGPFVVGWIKDATQSFEMGLYFLAGFSLIGGAVVFFGTKQLAKA